MALSIDDTVCDHVASTLLARIDKDEDRDQLLEMITCWCHTHFNFAKTAEALHIHKSTLVYRFQRTKDKFNLDLYDFDKVMALYLINLRRQLHLKI
jgi:sugar diacid utilization regulator